MLGRSLLVRFRRGRNGERGFAGEGFWFREMEVGQKIGKRIPQRYLFPRLRSSLLLSCARLRRQPRYQRLQLIEDAPQQGRTQALFQLRQFPPERLPLADRHQQLAQQRGAAPISLPIVSQRILLEIAGKILIEGNNVKLASAPSISYFSAFPDTFFPYPASHE